MQQTNKRRITSESYAHRLKTERSQPRKTAAIPTEDRTFIVSDTWDSRHMDKFLKKYARDTHPQNERSTGKSLFPTGSFGINSSAIPTLYSKVNNLFREGRKDLRDFSELDNVQVDPGDECIFGLDQYTTKNACPETQKYFQHLIERRQNKDMKKCVSQLCRRKKVLGIANKSGIVGYKAEQTEDKPRYSRILKKSEFADKSWGSRIFTQEQVVRQPIKPIEHRNILALDHPVRHNQYRLANKLKNDRRREYNFITLQKY